MRRHVFRLVALVIALALLGVGVALLAQDALLLACDRGWLWLARPILAAGPVLVQGRDSAGRTPLHLAVASGNSERLVTALLAAGADAAAVDDAGETPLHGASRCGDAGSVGRLLGVGASLGRVDQRGQTPLLTAVVAGHAGVVEQLLRAGARPTAVDADGKSALHLAGCNLDVVTALLIHGALVDARTPAGEAPLHLLVRCGPEVTRVLLAHRALPNALDGRGRTPIRVLKDEGGVDIAATVRVLLEFGAIVADDEPAPANSTAVASSRAGDESGAAASVSSADLDRQREPGLSPPIPAPEPTAVSVQVEVCPAPRRLAVARSAERGFEVYRIGDGRELGQLLDIDVGLGGVWVGTQHGVAKVVPEDFEAFVYGMATGAAGERIDELAIAGERVAAEVSLTTRPGYATVQGGFLLDPRVPAWTRFGTRLWDLAWDGERLWYGSRGAKVFAPATGSTTHYRAEPGGLLHDAVGGVALASDTVWFAMFGDYVKGTKSFTGGGVSCFEPATQRWKSWTAANGLAAGYCCSVAVDEDEAWVAHWHEELGVSVLNRRLDMWRVLPRSREGIELGGTVVALDGYVVWLGQQGGLVRYDRLNRSATRWREQDGLPGNIVSGIAVDADKVWVSAYSYDGKGGVRAAGVARFARGRGR
jgi:ankyrin repeat protein